MVSNTTDTLGPESGSEILDTLLPGEDGVLRYYEALLEEVERTIAAHNEAFLTLTAKISPELS